MRKMACSSVFFLFAATTIRLVPDRDTPPVCSGGIVSGGRPAGEATRPPAEQDRLTDRAESRIAATGRLQDGAPRSNRVTEGRDRVQV
jgi:hypothetical protein